MRKLQIFLSKLELILIKMKKHLYAFCIISCLCIELLIAQTKSTSIRILDFNYQPIEAAKLKVLESAEVFITDKQGKVFLDLDPNKIYTFQIEYQGEQYQEQIKNAERNLYTFYIGTKQNQIDEVVVSAARKFAEKKTETVGKMPQENLESSQSYNIIPQELLKERSVTDMKSALLAAPGIANITNGLGAGGFTVIAKMRGFSTGSGSLKNGYRTSQTTMSDLANIEAIEIIKGPAGTLYGTSNEISYGGIINIVTKKPKPYSFGEASYSYGAYDLSRLTLDFNTPINESKTVLFRFNTALQRGRTFQDFGKDNTIFFAPAFRFLVNDRLTLNIEAEYSKAEKNMIAVGYLPKGFNDLAAFDWNVKQSFSSNDLTMKSDVLNVMTSADYRISNRWTSKTIFSSANTNNHSNYLFAVPLTRDTIGRRIMRIPSEFITTSIQQNFVGVYGNEKWTNKLLIGVDYNDDKYYTQRKMLNYYDKVNRFQNVPAINMAKVDQLFANAQESAINTLNRTMGIYLSDVFSLNNRLHINAGLRMDRYKDLVTDFEETYFSPKFGAVYEVIDNQVSLFGNYTNGFTNGRMVLENVQFNAATIKPQEAAQYEFGVKYELFDKKLHGNASYYNIDVTNVPFTILEETGKSTTVQNGRQRSRGFEFDLTTNPFPGMHLIIGYGYNDSRFTKGDEKTLGKKPQGTPYHVGNFWASYSLLEGKLQGLGLGFGGNYSDDFYGDDYNTFKMPGYFLLDASVFYERDRFRVSVKGNNLTNKQYLTTNFWLYAQPTRTVLGTISYRF